MGFFENDRFKKVRSPRPDKLQNKPIINVLSDFDDETKQIYLGIYSLIKSKNSDKEFNVWATGSRVKGDWRTKEESDYNKEKYGFAKYSDYDYYTDAKVKPTQEEFFNILKVKVDLAGYGSRKVLINPLENN
jgi:predicted nucleotidyltransferase